MKHFIPRKTYWLKIAEVCMIVVIIFVGLFAYKFFNFSFFTDNNKFNFLSNFKYDLRFSKKINNKSFPMKENKPNTKSVPVLFYHGVMDKIDSSDTTNISYDNFADQMISLKENGWQTIKLEDFLLFIQEKKELPEKSFLLTFDDGRKDSYYPVDPILKALNYNAVIFVITENSMEDKKSSFYLSRKELKEMNNGGRWEIEAHTREGHNMYKIDQNGQLGHFYSNKLWLNNENRLETDEEFTERIKNDFVSAKSDIEKELGTNVLAFAYPFGDYGQESLNFENAKEILKKEVENIYPIYFYQSNNFNYSENQRMIKRIGSNEKIKKENLLEILNLKAEKTMPYFENKFENNLNWKNEWGLNKFDNNKMTVGSNDKSGGGMTILQEAKAWKNYIFQAKVNWKKGNNIIILARYNDDDNYLDCNFSSEWLRIEKVVEGKKFIKENKIDFGFSKTNLNLSIKVNGTNIECMLDNKIVGSADIETDKLFSGGIGFKTWDKEAGNSELEVLEVSVNNE